MESENTTKTKSTKELPTIDRVILGGPESEALSKWVEEFNAAAEGLVKVSKADMVNYLIASHAAKLTNQEMQEIGVRYYDETRWLSWSVNRMKAAKKKSVGLLFDDLIKFRDDFLGKNNATYKKRKTSVLESKNEDPAS